MRLVVAAPGIALALSLASGPAFAQADALEVDLGQGERLDLRRIPKGSFVEGSPANEPGRGADETPHPVTLGEDFYLGTQEVTVGQFKRFVADSGYKTEAEKGASGGTGWDGHALVQKKEFTWQNPGYVVTDRHPVTIVTYADALAFRGWLTRREGRTFSLPTEAEWEYAARAGSKTAWAGASEARAALALGWFKQNAPSGPHPVGGAAANAFGLHDMFGNAAEWCLDIQASYPSGEVKDPVVSAAPQGATLRRILRGGSWARDVKNGRSAARSANTPGSRNADNGFRVRAAIHRGSVAPLPTHGAAQPGNTGAPPARADGDANRRGVADSKRGEGAAVAIALAFFVGAFALVGAFGYWLLRRRHPPDTRVPAIEPGLATTASANVGFRLVPDGFWIDAPGHLVGKTCRYRLRTDAGVREADVDLEGTAGGQFVYTGIRPLEAALVSLRRAVVQRRPMYRPPVQQGSSRVWVDTSNDDDGPPSPPRFGGFPSAY